MSTATRYQHLRAELDRECLKAGRKPDDVLLLAVSKTVDIDQVKIALEAGAKAFGENRPDELLRKKAALPDVEFHFIGNIQSRRIPEIVASATLIHSLYQLRHAEKIDHAAAELSKVQDVLIEVNVSGEASKSGVDPVEAADLVRAVAALPHVSVRGLMTMAPADDAQAAREAFAGLAELAAQIRAQLPAEDAAVFTELSMGMSDDWREAVPLGATIVRVGRAIFSESYQE